MKWYVLHTYSGQENNVKQHIEMLVERESLTGQVGQVLVPTQEVVTVSRGRRIHRQRKHFPSYVIIEMDMNKDLAHLVTEIPGVTHFVGVNGKAQQIRKSEVAQLLGTGEAQDGSAAASEAIEIPYSVGDGVRIKAGPFKGFDGTVEEVSPTTGKLKVMVSVFGRSTPVELEFLQVDGL